MTSILIQMLFTLEVLSFVVFARHFLFAASVDLNNVSISFPDFQFTGFLKNIFFFNLPVFQFFNFGEFDFAAII